MPVNTQKISLFSLTAMVVGPIVKACIFNLPARFGTATRPFGALITWLIAFNWDTFLANVWDGVGMPEMSLIAQIGDTTLSSGLVFRRIDDASVYSRFTRTRTDAGTATILGFVGVTGIMVASTLLPFALMPRADVAALGQPSLSGPGGDGRPVGSMVHLGRYHRLGARRHDGGAPRRNASRGGLHLP